MTDPHLSQDNRVGVVQMIAAMVLSGFIGVFVVESQQPAINVVLFRCVLGGLCLGIYGAVRGYFRREYFTWRRLALMVLGGAFLVTNWLLLFESYRLTSITVATIVYHTQPFFVLIIGSLIFREPLRLSSVGWSLLAFAGVVLICDLSAGTMSEGGGYLQGVLFALGAAFCYGMATLTVKRLKEVKPHVVAFVQVSLGALVMLPLADMGKVTAAPESLGWLVGMGVIFTFGLYILLYSAYGKLKVAQIAVLSFVYPAVALVVDYAVYDYEITATQWLGMAMIALASYRTNSRSAAPEPKRHAQRIGKPTKD